MLKQLLSGQDGEWSSKRVSSFICLIFSIVFAFIGAIKGTTEQMTYASLFMGAALAFQGVSALQESALAGKLPLDGPK